MPGASPLLFFGGGLANRSRYHFPSDEDQGDRSCSNAASGPKYPLRAGVAFALGEQHTDQASSNEGQVKEWPEQNSRNAVVHSAGLTPNVP